MKLAALKRYRIAIVVQGRFHMFDLARELAKLGHDVSVFTNYPRWAAVRFGLNSCKVVSYTLHALTSRMMPHFCPMNWQVRWQDHHDISFGVWAAKTVQKHGEYDAVISMSGVALELFRILPPTCMKILHRGSIHIQSQRELLSKQQQTSFSAIRVPSDTIVRRELEEYKLTDRLTVISPLARESFENRDIPMQKVDMILLGVDPATFVAKPEDQIARRLRWETNGPLRVICAGSFSRRKGSAVWNDVFAAFAPDEVTFRIVGEINPDSHEIYVRHRQRVEFLPRVLESKLPEHYRWADLFLLPTIEDGFAVVVAQALSGAVPVLTTTGCGASCLIREGQTGWVVNSNDARAITEKLRALVEHRKQFLPMLDELWNCRNNYSNTQFAKDTIAQIEKLSSRATSP